MNKADHEAAERIRKECSHGDTEGAHYSADKILCELLESLGYKETVAAWDEIAKWYA
jgi:hypothetical protein